MGGQAKVLTDWRVTWRTRDKHHVLAGGTENNTLTPLFLTREGEHDKQRKPTAANVAAVTGF